MAGTTASGGQGLAGAIRRIRRERRDGVISPSRCSSVDRGRVISPRHVRVVPTTLNRFSLDPFIQIGARDFLGKQIRSWFKAT
ncbi:hypothetical protein BaRGS_00010089 [Batillaria attramentaria]|uniref:Uncharacterized protein n=1 Tax=Batillaria attramentaria TaxID=370345 RepID=A0ABD0LH81_9CAEN